MVIVNIPGNQWRSSTRILKSLCLKTEGFTRDMNTILNSANSVLKFFSLKFMPKYYRRHDSLNEPLVRYALI